MTRQEARNIPLPKPRAFGVLLLTLVIFSSLLGPIAPTPAEAAISEDEAFEFNRHEAMLALEAAARLDAIEQIAGKFDTDVGRPGVDMYPGPNNYQYVNLPTWLAIDRKTLAEADAFEKDATKSTVGHLDEPHHEILRVKVVVKAEAVATIWTFSDRAEPVICPGPGRGSIYAPGASEPPECGRDWDTASVDESVTMTVSLRYRLTWRSSYDNRCAGTAEEDDPPCTEPVTYESSPATTVELVVGEVAALGADPEAEIQPPQEPRKLVEPVEPRCDWPVFNGVCGFVVSTADALVDLVQLIGGAVVQAIRTLWSALKKCGGELLGQVTSLPGAIKEFISFVANPGAKAQEFIQMFKDIVRGMTGDRKGAFAQEILLPMLGIDPEEGVVSEVLGIACSEAVSYVAGLGGARLKKVLLDPGLLKKFKTDSDLFFRSDKGGRIRI